MTLMSKPLNRRTLLKTATAGSALLAAPGILRAQEAPAIKIGIVQPLTGALAFDGDLGRVGAELAVADINAEGGIKALGGAKIQLLTADCRSSPEGAAQEVERLQAEGVTAIIGGFASGLAITATQAAARYDLPFLVDTAVADAITQRGLKNTFRFCPSFSMSTAAALERLVKLNDDAGKPCKTVVLVHEDGLFGSGLAKLMQAELPKRGFEILETISHPTPARDMSNVALRIRSLNPDLVIPSHYYGEFVLLARTMQQQRIRPKGVYAIFGGAASSPRFVKEFPAAAEFVMDCNHWHDPKNPKAADLVKRVEATGRSYAYNVPANYSAVRLIADAIGKAGAADRAKLIETLRTGSFDSHLMPYGQSKFDAGGQNVNANPLNTQVQQGAIRVIAPADYAEVKPVFPVKA
jgi:branched-chain amino acid transport system substrate-binding protein